jgi:dihydroorotase
MGRANTRIDKRRRLVRSSGGIGGVRSIGGPVPEKQSQESAMSDSTLISRRRLIAALAAGGASAIGSLPRGARAAMGPGDKFDLLIKGGEVLDPSQSLQGMRDVGIRHGKVEEVAADIPADRAVRVLSAAGKLVVPGLVDLHTHVFPYGSALGIPADELAQFQATTTAVSAGDAGANNFAAFRRFIVGQSRTRLFAFIHIANHGLAGFPVPELYNLD